MMNIIWVCALDWIEFIIYYSNSVQITGFTLGDQGTGFGASY